MRVLEGDTIAILYTGRLDDGTVFISTDNTEPFFFTHGESILARVIEIGHSSVTLDANHPLAGRAITFDVLLVNILSKPAAKKERNS